MAQSTYQYRSLANPTRDIRTLNLLPGKFDDEIRIEISHQELSHMPEEPRMGIPELQATLPEGWMIKETRSNGYLFLEPTPNGIPKKSWLHPNQSLPVERYQLPAYSALQPEASWYEALSYTWGPKEKLEEILVCLSDDALMATYALSITPNLLVALRHLRHPDRHRKLWIDAICINQTDDAEKEAQVKRMGDIYRQASRVVMWLGPESESVDSWLTMSILGQIGSRVVVTTDHKVYDAPGATARWVERNGGPRLDQQALHSILCLLERPWFWRRWVVQEVALANRHSVVQCGTLVVELSLVRRGVEYLRASEDSLPHWLRFSVFNALVLLEQKVNEDLGTLLYTQARKLCDDPRDVVYALRALLPPGMRSVVVPDYSLSVAEAFRNIFLAHASFLGRWELFDGGLAARVALAEDGPSWVPDFQATNWVPGLDNPAGASAVRMRYAEGDQTLEVAGLRCSTVIGAPSTSPDNDKAAALAMYLNLWVASIPAGDSYPGTGETYAQAFMKTITLGLSTATHLPNNERRCESMDDWAECFGKLGIGLPDIPELSRREPTVEVLNSYPGAHITNGCRHRTFFSTASGHIGLGPPGLRPRDVIAVFLGCSRLMVLRSQPALDADRFQIVGHCHVYGWGDAAAILGPLPAPWKMRVKHIPATDRCEYRYWHPESGDRWDDPRLDDTPWPVTEDGIESTYTAMSPYEIGRKLTKDDPEVVGFFRNNETGEIVNSDPRMTPEELVKRGVNIETFTLI